MGVDLSRACQAPGPSPTVVGSQVRWGREGERQPDGAGRRGGGEQGQPHLRPSAGSGVGGRGSAGTQAPVQPEVPYPDT